MKLVKKYAYELTSHECCYNMRLAASTYYTCKGFSLNNACWIVLFKYVDLIAKLVVCLSSLSCQLNHLQRVQTKLVLSLRNLIG